MVAVESKLTAPTNMHPWMGYWQLASSGTFTSQAKLMAVVSVHPLTAATQPWLTVAVEA